MDQLHTTSQVSNINITRKTEFSHIRLTCFPRLKKSVKTKNKIKHKVALILL